MWHMTIPHFSLNGDEWIAPTGFMGAPTVVIEKLASGIECSTAVNHLENITKVDIQYVIGLAVL